MHFSVSVALGSFILATMSADFLLVSVVYALLCLSFAAQIV